MEVDTRNPKGGRVVWGLSSAVAILVGYTLVSNAYRVFDVSVLPDPVASVLRPQVLPPTQRLLDAFVQLVTGGMPEAGDAHPHVIDQGSSLPQQHGTLQWSLLVSACRVIVGVGVGAPLGILAGLVMGWSRKVDDYIHPIYILLRSIPPLALVTYVMLWFGHGETHRLIPIVYAVFATVVIPTYHGVRDVAEIYVRAARSLGARGGLLFAGVVLPAASPLVLAGFRYSLVIAWMTAVGVEMLMGENGIGHLLVGGGIWSSRLEIQVDPAVVMVGIAGLATAGYAMDTAAKLVIGRLTRWMNR